jgi:hypothetical protein
VLKDDCVEYYPYKSVFTDVVNSHTDLLTYIYAIKYEEAFKIGLRHGSREDGACELAYTLVVYPQKTTDRTVPVV